MSNNPAQFHTNCTRLRTQLLSVGAQALEDSEVLELSLAPAIGVQSAPAIVEILLREYGSFANVICAPVRRLRHAPGLGDAGIASLKIVEAGALRLARAEVVSKPVLADWERLMKYLTAALAREPVEQFRVLYLNTRNRLLADEPQARGTVNYTGIYPREVVKRALELDATALILVHNHPSGDPTPSRLDVETTREIQVAAEWFSISLHDHVIIGNGCWSSFRQEGLL